MKQEITLAVWIHVYVHTCECVKGKQMDTSVYRYYVQYFAGPWNRKLKIILTCNLQLEWFFDYGPSFTATFSWWRKNFPASINFSIHFLLQRRKKKTIQQNTMCLLCIENWMTNFYIWHFFFSLLWEEKNTAHKMWNWSSFYYLVPIILIRNI